MALPAQQAFRAEPQFKHGLPFLVQTPAAYVAITESDLLDWSGMWLVPKAGAKNTLEVQLAPPIPAQPWPARTPSANNGAAVAQSAGAGGEVRKAWWWPRLPTIPPGGRSSSAASPPTSFRATWC
jgi:hypothetical protein